MESESDLSVRTDHSSQSHHDWDHSYGALNTTQHTINNISNIKIELNMDSNIEGIELFPDLANCDSNSDTFSLGNAPTPYLPNIFVDNEGMNDLNSINELDLLTFESNDESFDINAFVNNEITIDMNNNCDNGMDDTIITNVMIDASEEQMTYSVTQEDIIESRKSRMQKTFNSSDNKRITRQKRHISCVDSEPDSENDSEYDAEQETIAVTPSKKGKKYVENNGQKTSKGFNKKCMTRNAIAARENREKKKEYVKGLEKDLSVVKKELVVMSANMCSLTKRYKDLESENEYFKNIVANLPQIESLVHHMKSAPNVELLGTSLCSTNDCLANTSKMSLHSNFDSNSVRKSNRIAAKIESSGICIHIKNTNQMSLEFCNKCSDASNKMFRVKKEK